MELYHYSFLQICALFTYLSVVSPSHEKDPDNLRHSPDNSPLPTCFDYTVNSAHIV